MSKILMFILVLSVAAFSRTKDTTLTRFDTVIVRTLTRVDTVVIRIDTVWGLKYTNFKVTETLKDTSVIVKKDTAISSKTVSLPKIPAKIKQ